MFKPESSAPCLCFFPAQPLQFCPCNLVFRGPGKFIPAKFTSSLALEVNPLSFSSNIGKINDCSLRYAWRMLGPTPNTIDSNMALVWRTGCQCNVRYAVIMLLLSHPPYDPTLYDLCAKAPTLLAIVRKLEVGHFRIQFLSTSFSFFTGTRSFPKSLTDGRRTTKHFLSQP